MKKTLLYTLAILTLSTHVFAQSPEAFKYQTVIRDNSQNPIPNQVIGMQITLLQGTITGSSVYQETFAATTNAYGLVNIEIGTGTVVSGTFSTIDWSAGPYFIKTALDAAGGTSYTVMGTSQLMSVPYALHAKTAESVAGTPDKTYVVLSGNITDAQAITKLQNDFGPSTQFLWIIGTTQLTTVDLTAFNTTELVGFRIANNQALTAVSAPHLANVWDAIECSTNPSLTTISLPVLTSSNSIYIYDNTALTSISLPTLSSGNIFCNGNTALTSVSLPALSSGGIGFDSSPALTSISLPVLTSGNSISIDNTALTSLSLPALTSCSSLRIHYNTALTSISLPVLTSCSSLSINYNTALTSISLPVLTSSNSISIDNTALTSLSLPALTSCSSLSIDYNTALTSISLPSWTTSPGGASDIRFNGNALSTAVVNSLLNQMVALSPILTGRQIYLYQQPPAPPTGQGITDKATLIANGNNVDTD